MDTLEIKPKLINENNVSFFVFFTVFSLIMFGILKLAGPTLFEIDQANPGELPVGVITMLILAGVMVFILFITTLSVMNKKIRITSTLIEFMSKFPFGNWKTDKAIDLSNVEIIKDRKVITGGKYMSAIVFLDFIMKDKSIVSYPINNISGIKNLLFYIHGKFSEIKMDNGILRDSPEKLAGLSNS